MRHYWIFGIAMLALLLGACSSTPTYTSDPKRAAQANLELGVAYYREGRLQLAMENLQRAVELDPDLAQAHGAIAILYERLGENESAERHYRRALALAPADSRTNNNFGQFLCHQKRLQDADRHFRQAVADPLYDTPEVAYTNAGICARRIPDVRKAEEYFRLALERNPFYPQALLQMLSLNHEQGEYLRARAYLQRYQQVSRHGPESLWLGIRVEHALGDKNAEASYGLALRNNFPDAPQTRAYLEWLNEQP
ncbi:MAG: type IV pilus biogenesis/stability protein PilW [Xanthomonadaceae bacterium]|nr:type IV pilus biogenesis/stability protein PilW [Xanthomonadaceae bacterium]